MQNQNKTDSMRTFIIFFIVVSVSYINKVNGQGCVAIRSTGAVCSMTHERSDTTSGWLFNANSRYFKSFRHFVGTDEQKQRQELGTEVINHQYTMDLSIIRLITPRWSILVDVPIESNSRSSLYEHKNLGRFLTHSFGVGDIRLAVYSWLLNPVHSPRGNVQVGLGIKLPTGNYNYQDYFRTSDTTKILGPVDQSIQLGDGGTGITTEINAYYNFSRTISVYGNFFYLINPREVNGISTARGGVASANSIKNGSDVMSVPDQYMVRAGANFLVRNWMFSAGARQECIPVHDVVGGSNGFRRPGYIISAEPGVTYNFKKVSVYGFVPFALVRNRTQSVPDKISSSLTGKETHGDAAFADYVVTIGTSIRF